MAAGPFGGEGLDDLVEIVGKYVHKDVGWAFVESHNAGGFLLNGERFLGRTLDKLPKALLGKLAFTKHVVDGKTERLPLAAVVCELLELLTVVSEFGSHHEVIKVVFLQVCGELVGDSCLIGEAESAF